MTEKKQKKTEGKKEEKQSENSQKSQLIAVIRISGMAKVKSDIEETLYRLKLRRKYSCSLVNPNNNSVMGALDKVKFYVAYGTINKETLVKLLESRARSIEGNKIKLFSLDNKTSLNKKETMNAEKTADELLKGKKLKELGFKPFFRLHPPRKGIKSKLQYPRGVLGNNKEDINKLIERML